MIINCKEISANIKKNLIIPKNIGLVIIQVGNDEGSNFYVKSKVNDCADMGIVCHLIKKDQSTTEELVELIKNLNEDSDVTGIIVQLPLPANINADKVTNTITLEKDIDGFRLGSPYTPCTPKGIMNVLHNYLDKGDGLSATLIGRGKTVGKPLRDLLIDDNYTLTVCHSKTSKPDLEKAIKKADVVISCAGHPNLITKNMVHKGQLIIDVGISRVDGKQVGDVNKEAWNIAWCTSWVGGIGLMTRTALLENLVLSAEINNRQE